MSHLEPDPAGAASVLHMADHLVGPLQAGAIQVEVAIDADGRVAFEGMPRAPVVLIAARVSLGDEALVVEATIDPDGGARELPPIELSSWSEAGSFLPLRGLEDGAPTAGFVAQLRARAVDADGVVTAVAPSSLAARLKLVAIDGQLARLLYAAGAEKARLRREARVLAASRRLQTARDAALDRIGGDLGVARFATDLVAPAGVITTVSRREPDAEYRRRLALFRRFLVPNRRSLAAALDEIGPGYRIVEDDNQLAVAIRLIETGPPGPRASARATARARRRRSSPTARPRRPARASLVRAGRAQGNDRRGRMPRARRAPRADQHRAEPLDRGHGGRGRARRRSRAGRRARRAGRRRRRLPDALPAVEPSPGLRAAAHLLSGRRRRARAGRGPRRPLRGASSPASPRCSTSPPIARATCSRWSTIPPHDSPAPRPAARSSTSESSPAFAGADTGFVRLAPGHRFPWHRHTGAEHSLVLAGHADDVMSGRLGPGDEAIGAPGTEYDFTTAGDEDFIYAVWVWGVDFSIERAT